jgi:hypothetical protein
MNGNDIVKLILNFFELLALAAGFYYMPKWKNSYWRYFPYLLLLIFVSEMMGKYTFYNDHLKPYNYIVYRYVYNPASTLFYFSLAYQSLKGKTLRLVILCMVLLYISAWLMEQFVLGKDFIKNNTLSKCVGFTGLLFLIITWLIRFVRSKEVLEFKTNIQFWVYAGLLICYTVTLPFLVLRYALYKSYPDVFDSYWYLPMFFNCILYIFFTIGLIWGKPKSSYSL